MERTVYNSQEGELVDKLLEIVFNSGSPEIKTLVGHKCPDDDTWLCCWIAKRFIPKAASATITFVNAGKTLSGTENDPSVLHFDTGGGEYDQHNKRSWRMSSAQILVNKLREKLNLKEPALRPLVELATATDNIKRQEATSIHSIIDGYPRLFKKNGNTDWDVVQGRIFELFDIVYGQEKQRVESREKLGRLVEWIKLPNGIKIAVLFGHPALREAAFEAGAAVVVWTQDKGGDKFYTGIQKHRDVDIHLNGVAANIRWAESKERGIDASSWNLQYVGLSEKLPWFLHDSEALIVNGSRGYPLKENEYTKLKPRQIVAIVRNTLSKLPPINASN